MLKNTIRLEILASDLESRLGPEDDSVLEVKEALAKHMAALSALPPKFPQERRMPALKPVEHVELNRRQKSQITA